MSPASKKCTRCGATKSLDHFGYRSDAKDGRSCWCRSCHSVSSSRGRRLAQVKHYEEKYQHLLTQETHPGYIYRCKESDRNGQHCRAVLFTRYGQMVVEFDDGVRLATRQIHLRRAKED